MRKTEYLTVRIDEDVKNKLKKEAVKQQRQVSNLVQMILKTAMDKLGE